MTDATSADSGSAASPGPPARIPRPLRRPPRRPLAAGVLSLALLGAGAFAIRVRSEMADFEVYRTAGARAVAAAPPYRKTDRHYQFKYFPATALLFVPFARLPPTAARAVWFTLSLVALVTLIGLSLRTLPARTLPAWVLVAGTVATLAKFYGRELVLGQINLLMGALAMVALGRLLARRDLAAGALFGAAVALKPYALIFLPYLAATGRRRAAAACAAVAAGVAIVPAAIYGIDGNLALLQAWWTTVGRSTPANLIQPDNISIAAMYAKWLGPGPPAAALAAATALGLAAGCLAVVASARRAGPARALRPQAPEYLDVALLLTATALLSPQGWDYVLLLATPAVMLLINALPRLGGPARAATVCVLAATGLTLYDVMGRAAYGRFMAWSIPTLLAGAILAVLGHIRSRGLH